MRKEWRLQEGEYRPVVIAHDGKETQVTWAPQPGSQEAFLSCPITEVLYAGTRGPGKTDALLMDFAQHVGRGFGADWNGIIFRRTFPELKDIINKSRKWFPRIWPNAKFNASQYIWTWATGEMLSFRQFNKPADYWKYHGHCLDEGEVLTSQGWVPIEHITTQMRVMSATSDGQIVEKPVISTTKEWFDGDLVRYSGRGRYMSFTPEHKIAVAVGEAGHELIPYTKAGRNISLRTGGWTMPDVASSVVVPSFFRIGTTTQDYCAFMGWYLAEGWTLKNGARKSATYKCGIAQSKAANPEKYAVIESLLRRILPVNICTGNNGFVWSYKECADYLRQFGGSLNKFIPRQIIERGNSADVRAFLAAYIDGDGTRQLDRMYGHTISKAIADGLCELAPRAGYSAHMTQRIRANRSKVSYTVAFNPRPTLNLRSDNRERAARLGVASSKVQVARIPYHGHVYCIGVEDTHAFFVRQRGSVWLSGNSYPFIGWEELTTWPTDECFKSMFSCSRSAMPGMPRKVRATTNPYGIGHNWCKARYRLPVKPGRIIGEIITDSKDESNQNEPPRVAIHGYLDENQILLRADPEYKQRLRAAARNPSELKAWLEGSWDIVAGGMVDDVWDAKVHAIEPFKVPTSWVIERAFDWGSSKPFSLGWWAESDGTPLPDGRVFYRGTRIRIAEWYGWNKKPNEGLKMLAVEIARKGLEMEKALGLRVQAGPADPSIFAAENGVCIADDMARAGMGFRAAQAGPGSRKTGAERVRKYLKASMKKPMEEPGLFVFNTCSQFLRTVPVIPRDLKDPDDVDCLVAGTMVDTPSGQMPIERVQVGQFVSTPIGARRVFRAGLSGYAKVVSVLLSNGEKIIGTADHHVFTYERGLVPLGELVKGLTLHERESWLGKSSITASNIVDTAIGGIGSLVSTLLPQAGRACIDRSGSIIMAQSQMDIISTISTTIPTTTQLKTWSLFIEQTMRDGMYKNGSMQAGICESSWMLGGEASKGNVCFERMLRKCMRALPYANLRALIAAWLLQRNILTKSIAQKPAKRHLDGMEASQRFAACVGLPSWLRRTAPKKSRLAVIGVDGPCGEAAVYNLTVEQAHLFYANGALVSNTDAEDHIWDEMRYELMTPRHSAGTQKLVGV